MEAENSIVTYSPAAVLNLFNNSISVSQAKRIIQLKGIYVPGKGALYSGYYYDTFRDESSDAAITILVPPLIRSELQPNKTVTVNGFITRRIIGQQGSIQIQLTVTDLVEQTQNKYNEEDLKKLELMQAKANGGYRDVYGWLKEKIISEEPFKIGIIIGKTGIIDNDIKHQLRESIGFYDLTFHRVNLSSEIEIVSAIDRLTAEHYGFIAVSRGGGDNLEIFNKLSLAEKVINIEPLFITAIGHKDDVTLLQRVADKSFITPSELGQFLNDTYNHTVEELQNSKAKLIESVTTQLKAGFEKEIGNLNDQLKANEQLRLQTVELQNEKATVLNDQIQNYKAQISTLEGKTSVNWGLVVIAIILGIIIGFLLKGH
jgi:exodeoxyribonuclease VII large subunit